MDLLKYLSYDFINSNIVGVKKEILVVLIVFDILKLILERWL